MSLNVIIGCMFSGKTTKLIETITDKYTEETHSKIYIITSSLDTRTTKYIQTHTGIKLFANKRDNLDFTNEELSILQQHYNIIVIDEGQFFPNLVHNIKRMIEYNLEIYIAGLDADFNQEKFGEMIDLIPIANCVIKLTGLCDICGNIGAFTRRINKDINKQILIGDKNEYLCVCRTHL